MRWCFIIMFLFYQTSYSQEFRVEVSQKKVSLHESFEISFILDAKGKRRELTRNGLPL